MPKPPGNVCCHVSNFPVRFRRTRRWCGSNCSHATTASSIEIWPSCVNRSIKCRRACPMDVGSPLPCAQPVAFFLRRRCPKYRDTLLVLPQFLIQLLAPRLVGRAQSFPSSAGPIPAFVRALCPLLVARYPLPPLRPSFGTFPVLARCFHT